MTILRILLVIALACGFFIHSYDICTAFMQAPLREPELVLPPPECQKDSNNPVIWILKKAVNGLRTAPKDYQDFFAGELKSIGFKRLISDTSVYYHETKNIYLLTSMT